MLTLAGSPGLSAAAGGGEGGGHAKSGAYSGVVGPGYPISFRVAAKGAAVEELVVSFEETCNGAAGETAPKFHFKTLKITDGKFSGSSSDHFGPTASDALRINGSIDGGAASGKVTDTSKIKSLPTCTESEPFTAKAK